MEDFVILKKEFPDEWQNLIKKLANPYEYFIIDEYKKPVDTLQKEDFFSKLKNNCPEVDEITRTKKLLEYLILKMEKN